MAVVIGLTAAMPPSWTPPAPDFGTILAKIAAPPVDIRPDRVKLIHPVWRR